MTRDTAEPPVSGPKRPNQRPKNKAARHAYVSRKKPGFDRLSYETLKEVSAIVGGWNDALFAYAQTKVQRAGSVCEEPLQDEHNNVVLDEIGRAVMVGVCPLCQYCRSEVKAGYDPVCVWNDDDMADALRRLGR